MVDGKREHGGSTVEIVQGEVEDVAARKVSTLGQPWSEPPRPKSIPPPLPRSRTVTPSGPRPVVSSSAPPSHTRPPAPGPSRSVPPPLPHTRVSGLGRPASMPPPRPGTATAQGIPAPSLEHDDDHERAAVSLLEIDPATFREAARSQADEWERALAEARSTARRGRLAFELAQLHEGPLRDLVKASTYYRSALAAMPEHLPSLRGARRVAIARKDYRAALPLLDSEARLTPDARRKAALLFTKGRLLEDALGQKDEARALYATAAELDRTNASILEALAQRDRESHDAAKLERTYERMANAVAADPRHRAALIVARARILEHRQGRVDAALELYETALRLDPQAGGALDAVERLCAAHGRHRELIHALERRAGESGDPEERALALYRVARLHAERLGNREEAIAALERAAAERPDDELVLEALANDYERAARFEELTQVLQRLAERNPDAAEQRAAWHRVGQLFDEQLDAKDDARAAYERALALDPTHLPTVSALERLYEAAGAWEALIAMHARRAEATREPSRRAAIHARVAELLERRGDAKEDAMAHHARALSLAPDHAPSFSALTRLYAEAGRHRALLELHERAVERAREAAPTEGAEHESRTLSAADVVATTHLFKIGAVQEDALGEHAQAAHTYARILAIDPTNLGALHALQRASERAGRHAELVDALEREASLRGAPASISLLTRAGEVLETELDDDDAAIVRYRGVLELDPRHTPALGGLRRIFQRAGRWEDLLELYERELALEPKNPALLHAMGQLSEAQLGDEAQALELYRRALQVDPAHGPSLRSLERRLAARKEHAERAELLERALERRKDPSGRARAAFRLGEIHEVHLGAHDRAMAAYQSALAALPGYLPAAVGLARVREAEGAWRRLVEQLEQEAASIDDPARIVAKLTRAAEIFARALGDPRRAADCYERALALAPRHLESLLALQGLFALLGRTDALARVHGTLARVLVAPGARVASLRELARLEERGTRKLDELRAIHEAILGLMPDDPGSLEALEALALEQGDRALLARVDRLLIQRAGDPKTAAAYQTRLAASLEAAGDASALAAYRAALESDPENVAAARGLARVAEEHGMPEAVVLAARREAAMTPEPRLAAAQLVRAAKVAHRDLGQVRTALSDYERALELWPDDADAADGIEAILLSAGQPARAVDRLSRAAKSATRPERVAALWVEVARLQSELLDDVPGALTSLERVQKSVPDHIPALQRTAALHARDGRWHDAATLLAKLVALAPDRAVLQAAHLELARLWAEHLDELPRALVSLQAVLALDEDHPEALRRLADVAERSGDREKAVETLRKLLERAASSADRVAAWLRLSEVHAQHGDDGAALEAAREALALEGLAGDAAARHRELITTDQGWEAHVAALREWLTSEPRDSTSARGASLEIARIERDILKRPARAVDVLERLAREDPGDVEARRTLASTLRMAGRFDEALAELRSLVGEHVTRAELWRELSQTFRAAGDAAGAQRALLPLALLERADGDEARDASSRTPNLDRVRAGSLDAAILEALYPTRRAGSLLTLLRHAMPALGKLYPADFDVFGISSKDWLSARSADPMRAVADRVTQVFAAGEVHVYLHRARGHGIAVELTTPPSILIPAAIAELDAPHRTFAIARVVANVAAGLHAVDKLTPRELEIVLAAIARRVAPGFGAGLTSEELLDDIHRRFFRALPRRAKRDLEEAARAYVAAGERDFAAVTEAVHASAQRLALLVSDDLLASIDVLKRTERDIASLEGPRLVAHPTVSRLVRFWISPEADALRQRMGLTEPVAP